MRATPQMGVFQQPFRNSIGGYKQEVIAGMYPLKPRPLGNNPGGNLRPAPDKGPFPPIGFKAQILQIWAEMCGSEIIGQSSASLKKQKT